jgi:hypothetical protein
MNTWRQITKKLTILTTSIILFSASGCAIPAYVAVAGFEASKLPGLKSKSRIAVGNRFVVVTPVSLEKYGSKEFELRAFTPEGNDSYEAYKRDPRNFSNFHDIVAATDQHFTIRITKIKTTFGGMDPELVFRAQAEDGPFQGKMVDISHGSFLLSQDGFGADPSKLVLVEQKDSKNEVP